MTKFPSCVRSEGHTYIHTGQGYYEFADHQSQELDVLKSTTLESLYRDMTPSEKRDFRLDYPHAYNPVWDGELSPSGQPAKVVDRHGRTYVRQQDGQYCSEDGMDLLDWIALYDFLTDDDKERYTAETEETCAPAAVADDVMDTVDESPVAAAECQPYEDFPHREESELDVYQPAACDTASEESDDTDDDTDDDDTYESDDDD